MREVPVANWRRRDFCSASQLRIHCRVDLVSIVVQPWILCSGGFTDLPEVDDNLVGFRVPSVVGMLLPVLDVDIGDTANKELQFALVEDVDEIWRDQFVESGYEGGELLLHPFLYSPFGDEAISVS